MITKTVRSRFPHEVGEKVEGCTILESRVVIPPNPAEMRRGVYEYVVEVPPAPAPAPKTRTPRQSAPPRERESSQTPESFTRATPEEMGGRLIRRLPSR
ncbi:MAG TPA: hypothetical protein VKU19_20435 [Bryobacteraceae bacterium]|nr:hypothetical protein [Bryobacteraceae bacterium]